MIDQGQIKPEQGLSMMRDFLHRRWRGQHPILWGRQMDQAELLESFHCGHFCQELFSHPSDR
jgi:glycerol-3-phosphate dehydrogenase